MTSFVSRYCERAGDRRLATTPWLVFLLCLMLPACQRAEKATETVAQSRAALTVTDVMGFEDPSGWSSGTTGAVLSRSTTHDQGSFSLQLAPSTSNGNTPITNTGVGKPQVLGPHLDFDIMLPTQQPNPSWFGTAQVFVNCLSRGVNNVFLGQVELTNKPLGSWVTLDFAVPDTLISALLNGGYSDLKFTLAINVPVQTTPQVPHLGVYRIDNLRFLAAAAAQCPGRPNGTNCDDANACTTNETCQSGKCTPAATVTCTTDQCHTVAACVPASGCPAPVTKANGTPCDDGNACTLGDLCQAGSCVSGGAKSCPASDQCHAAGACNTTTGACSNPAVADGTSCSDGDACTGPDTCKLGVCTTAGRLASCAVTPQFEGLVTVGGATEAVFSYQNSTPENIDIPYGVDNNLSDGAGLIAAPPVAPPEWFLTGEHRAVLVAPITDTLTWKIRGQSAVASVSGSSLPTTNTPRGPVATLPDGSTVPVDLDPGYGIFPTDTIGPGLTTGKTEGTFAVSADGAATYRLPIWVPPGRGGLQPTVALSYNSRHGTGTLGVGWSLEGISEISRCAKKVATDGVAAEPKFEPGDALCLNGKRLVRVSGSGLDGSVYWESETSFAKIIQHGDLGSPTTFEVRHRDGSVALYDKAVLPVPGTGHEVSWMIGSLTDKAGNVLKYRYTDRLVELPDPGPGVTLLGLRETLLNRIDYVFSDQAGTTPTRSVVIDYEPLARPEVRTQWQHQRVFTQRIAGIRLQGPDPNSTAELRRYSFTYETGALSKRDRLLSVTECGGGDTGICKRPTTFHYADDTAPRYLQIPATFPETTQPVDGASGFGTTSFRSAPQIVDLNGDGLDDALWIKFDSRLEVSTPFGDSVGNSGGTPVARLSDGTKLGPEIEVKGGLPFIGEAQIYPVDFDGDGLTDILASQGQKAGFVLQDYFLFHNTSVRGSQNPDDIHFEAGPEPFIQVQTDPTPPVGSGVGFGSRPYFTDVDGDGILDLLQGHGVPNPNNPEQWLGYEWNVTRGVAGGTLGSVTDLVLQTQGFLTGPLGFKHETVGGMKLAQREGRAFVIPTSTRSVNVDGGTALRNVFQAFDVDAKGAMSSFDPGLFDDEVPSWITMDMNGDGLPEVVKVTAWTPDQAFVKNIFVAHNLGRTFTPDAATTVQTSHAISGIGSWVTDFNQDGWEDLALVYEIRRGDGDIVAAPTLARVGVYQSTGWDLSPPVVPLDDKGNEVISLYHEAATDFAASTESPDPVPLQPFGSGGAIHSAVPLDVNGDGLTDILVGPVLYVRQGGRVDLLTGVVDGQAHDTIVKYRSLGDRGPMRPGSDTPFYAHTADANYPLVSEDKGLWAVAEVDVDAGVTGRDPDPRKCDACGVTPDASYHQYFYAYENGRQNALDDEWLGFTKRSVYDAARGQTTVTTYDTTQSVFSHVFWGRFRPTSEETTLTLPAHDTDIRPNPAIGYRHRIDYQYQISTPLAPAAVEVFAALPERIVDEETDTVDRQLIIRRVETTLSYDDFGNVQSRTDARAGVESRTVTTAYENRTGGTTWLLGLPTLVTETSTPSNGDPAVTRTADHVYDSQGFLQTEIVEPNADASLTLTRTFERNAFGAITATTEQDLTGQVRRSETGYDPSGIFPVRSKNPLGHVTREVWHPGYGLLVFTEDPNGAVAATRYDRFGRTKTVEPPDGSLTVMGYATSARPDLSNEVAEIGLDGRLVAHERDRLDREVVRSERLPDASSGVVTTTYDTLGRVATRTSPALAGAATASITSYTYDARDRPIQVVRQGTQDEGVSTTTSYYSGKTVVVAEAQVQTDTALLHPLHLVVNDELGRAARVIDYKDATEQLGVMTTFDYGAFGLLLDVTSAGVSTTFEYDTRGRQIGVSDASSGPTTYAYDAWGNLVSYVDAVGQTTSRHVDALNRLVSEDSPLGECTYAWDNTAFGIGRPGGGTSSPGTGSTEVATAYDVAGHVVHQDWTIHGRSFGVDYDYDTTSTQRGKLAHVIYPAIPGRSERVEVEYRYSQGSGELATIGPPGGGTPFYAVNTRDAAGRVAEESFGANVTRTLGYHSIFDMLSSAHATVSGAVVQDLALDYDGRAAIVTRIDRAAVPGSQSGIAETFDYDVLGRLRHWDSTTGDYSVEYGYDDLGNLTSRQLTQQGTAGPATVFRFGERGLAAQQLSSSSLGSYDYDANGDQIAAPGRTVTFAPFHLPLHVAAAGAATDFEYDPWHARSYKTSPIGTTSYVAGIYERRSDAAGVHHVMRIAAEGRVVAELSVDESAPSAAPAVRYLLDDQLGAPAVIVGAAGQVEAARYEPFGARLAAGDTPAAGRSGDAAVHLGFAGAEQEDELGLINMNGRIYDPQINRFLSTDPEVSAPHFSQAHHRYAYALNSPLSHFDPTGFNSGSPFASDGDGPPSLPADDSQTTSRSDDDRPGDPHSVSFEPTSSDAFNALGTTTAAPTSSPDMCTDSCTFEDDHIEGKVKHVEDQKKNLERLARIEREKRLDAVVKSVDPLFGHHPPKDSDAGPGIVRLGPNVCVADGVGVCGSAGVEFDPTDIKSVNFYAEGAVMVGVGATVDVGSFSPGAKANMDPVKLTVKAEAKTQLGPLQAKYGTNGGSTSLKATSLTAGGRIGANVTATVRVNLGEAQKFFDDFVQQGGVPGF